MTSNCDNKEHDKISKYKDQEIEIEKNIVSLKYDRSSN